MLARPRVHIESIFDVIVLEMVVSKVTVIRKWIKEQNDSHMPMGIWFV